MNHKGTFTTGIDLADLGEHDCSVRFDGYRATKKAADDFDSMEITVTMDLGGKIIDVTALLTADAKDRITEEAWAEMPSKESVAAERADVAYQQWRDDHLERCCA